MIKRRITKKTNIVGYANLPRKIVGRDTDLAVYAKTAGIKNGLELKASRDTIIRLKNKGLWTKLACVYLMSPTSLSAALVCAKSRTVGTAVNSPTHAKTGVTFDGATNYIDTNVAHSAGNFPGVPAGISVYVSTHSAPAGVIYYCGVNTTNKNYRLTSNSNKFYFLHFGVSVTATSTTNSGTAGFYSSTFPSSSDARTYYNSTNEKSASISGLTPSYTDNNIFIGGANNAGTLSNPVSFECKWASFFNSGPSVAQSGFEYAIALQYQTALKRN